VASEISGAAGTFVGNARRFRPRRFAGLLLAAPAIAYLALFFVLPMAEVIGRSLAGSPLTSYEKVLTNGLYRGVFIQSASIALQVTVIDLIIAYPLAFYVTTLSRRARLVAFFFILLPFWSSQLVRTYAWTIILGRNGLINQLVLALGLVEEPLTLLNTRFAVLLGSAHVMLPFMVLPLYASMAKIDGDLLKAASLFGANGWNIFRRVHLPLCRSGIAAGATLVFILTLGSFTTAAVLGGGRVMMIALLIEQQVRTVVNWTMASALATVLLAVTIMLYWACDRVLRGRAVDES